MAVLRQVQGQIAQVAGDRLQRQLEVNRQVPLAQLLHQDVLVLNQDDLALGDDPDPVGHLLGLLDIVGGEDDGDASGPQGPDHLPHVPSEFDIDPRRGLVQEQDGGLVAERLGDHHPPLHAPGQGHDLGVLLVPEGQVLQDLFDMGRIGGLAEQAPGEGDRIPDSLEGVRRQFLGNQADLAAGGAIIADDVVTRRGDLPLCRIDDAADDADQGGLARAIGAKQGEDLALGYREIDTIDCYELSVGFLQPFDLNHLLHKCHCATLEAKVRENRA